MSFLIGCGGSAPSPITPIYTPRDINLALSLSQGEQKTITKKNIQEILGGSLALPGIINVGFNISLNYRFFSGGSTVWLLENGERNNAVVLGYVWTSSGDLHFLYNGSSKNLIHSPYTRVTPCYPFNTTPNNALAKYYTDQHAAYGERDVLHWSFKYDLIKEEGQNFSLVFKRGSQGRDDYLNTKGSSLISSSYVGGDRLCASNFLIPKEKRKNEYIIGKWNDSLNSAKFEASFFEEGSDEGIEPLIASIEEAPKEYVTTASKGNVDHIVTFQLYKKNENIVMKAQAYPKGHKDNFVDVVIASLKIN